MSAVKAADGAHDVIIIGGTLRGSRISFRYVETAAAIMCCTEPRKKKLCLEFICAQVNGVGKNIV